MVAARTDGQEGKVKRQELRARWRSGSLVSLRQEILRRLPSGESLTSLDIGTHDGRLDLRGIDLSGMLVESRHAGLFATLRPFAGASRSPQLVLEGIDFGFSDLRRVK